MVAQDKVDRPLQACLELQQAALALSRLQSARTGRFQSAAGEFLEAAEWMREELSDSEAEEWLGSEESTEMARFY